MVIEVSEGPGGETERKVGRHYAGKLANQIFTIKIFLDKMLERYKKVKTTFIYLKCIANHTMYKEGLWSGVVITLLPTVKDYSDENKVFINSNKVSSA